MSIVEFGVVASIVLVGLLAGDELGTLIIHATLDGLLYAEGRPAAQAIVKRLGVVMPVAMPLTVVVTLLTGFGLNGSASLLLIIAGAVLVVMVVITFVKLIPLNVRKLRASAETPESDWRAWRKRWLHWHSIRVGCDLAALVMAAFAAVTN